MNSLINFFHDESNLLLFLLKISMNLAIFIKFKQTNLKNNAAPFATREQIFWRPRGRRQIPWNKFQRGLPLLLYPFEGIFVG
jgi:hypothetical protein